MTKRIKIWHNFNAENPWKEWDCMIPLMTEETRNYTGKDYSNGGIMKAIKEKATKGRVLRHQQKIAQILDLDLDDFKEREFTSDEKYNELYYYIVRADFNQIHELLNLFKIPNILYTSRGYSQGDVQDILIVQTEKWKKETSRKFSKEVEQEEFESAKKLYDAWAWGDTFGFTIEEKKKFIKTYEDGTKEDGEEWVQIDSCGGFFGSDWKTNGMLDHVPEELHEQLLNYDSSDVEYYS